MMDSQSKSPAMVGPGYRQKHPSKVIGNADYSKASINALTHELAIILAAAHRMASGHSLAWDDYDRLHIAHQHVLTVLAAVTGREVLQ